MTETMTITAIDSYFGGKRTMAPEIVRQLGPHQYYFEGCCGSMAVLFAKEPSEHEVVCDLHGALTNLALIVQNRSTAEELFERCQRALYSDQLYQRSKQWLADNEGDETNGPGDVILHHDGQRASLVWAYHYFIASWMGRNGVAGTAHVNYQQAVRWTKGGGSGPLRFRNAVDSIPAWCERLRNVNILRRDLFLILPKLEDSAGLAIYVDPPYLPSTVAANSRYLHDFKPGDHERLAEALASFRHARVVVSYYYSVELLRLYPKGRWSHRDCSRHKNLHTQNKRGSKRVEAPEVLLVNGPVYEQAAGLFS